MTKLQLVDWLRKLRVRAPKPLGAAGFWLRLQDWLVASHHLSPARRCELEARRRACTTSERCYDFAHCVFPSHQIAKEIVGFLELARGIAPQTVMEIGTAEGGTNFLLGAALPDVSLEIGVDLYVQNTLLLEIFGRPGLRQVFLNASSYAPETVARIRTLLDGRQLDVLFIDGDHTYAGAMADYTSYVPLVRSGGLIAFHDIVPDYRTRYGRDTGRWAGDVPQLWQDLRGSFAETWEFVADRDQDGLGIGVGRVK